MNRYKLMPAPIAPLPVRSARSVLGVLLALLLAQQAAGQNIVLILSDDQGWTGTSVRMDDRVNNSVSDLYQTPSLERLAAEGMKFSNAYSPAPNCSPTRMSIQTGKTAARLGATDIIDVVADENGVANIQVFHDTMYFNKPMIVPFPISDIPDGETTIAELLKRHDPDYATGHFGKWHMGGGSPERHGYDAHDGLTTNDEGFAPQPDAKRSDEVTDGAVTFIEEQAGAGRPFFVQVSYYAVHTPVRARPETLAKYSDFLVQKDFGMFGDQTHTNAAYAAMTEGDGPGRGAHPRHVGPSRRRRRHLRHLHLGQRGRIRQPGDQQRAAGVGQDPCLGGWNPRAVVHSRSRHRRRHPEQ